MSERSEQARSERQRGPENGTTGESFLSNALTYTLRFIDDIPATHVLIESVCLPAGEIWRARGFLFVPPELGAKLGPPDDAVAIGTNAFHAWSLPGKR